MYPSNSININNDTLIVHFCSFLLLLLMANSSGRDYGSFEILGDEYDKLKERFLSLEVPNTLSQADKWLLLCKRRYLYEGVEGILNFALCCFVKSPLEATAESIGSVINQHARQQRYSLLPSSIGNEVQVAWNGPQVFSSAATSIIKEALQQYFKAHKSGPRFSVSTKIKLMSNTVKETIEKPSKITLPS